MNFISWVDWRTIKESNARKRAVQNALKGIGPDLPGSAAACPSTNPVAMNVAKKKGVVTKAKWRGIQENHIARPDYSIDRWLSSAKELGDDVNSLVNKAKEDEEELDKKKEKEPEPEKPKVDKKEKPEDFEPKTKEQKESWKKFKELHKDREKEATATAKVAEKPVLKKPSSKSSSSASKH